MTDTPGSTPPFPGFPGFPPAEMLERMWGMMRLSPFGSAFSGAQPAGGLGPSLSMMSDMMAPLTNVEELDKRITDMRAVEQWLKLNLSMLQSAIQALEVQRATLATLRAFGAFAQSSMSQPASAAAAPGPAPAPAAGWSHSASSSASGAASDASSGSAESDTDTADTAATPPFDASAWWDLLQSQFNQIAQFAITQPGVASAGAASGTAAASPDEAETNEQAASAKAGSKAEAAAKRPAAKRAPSSAKRASSSTASPRATKKSI
ncbi:PhaM family polyhydroxyalkanoate granule multifunctional regulatory protein [Paraburkholderia sp. SIMBA_030]|uniref:PhaM family polyhydroxyalkanoate granule multifunctional regulatory protein n=1 Tax=Paraburkholderia sp. SIMBA_030 TaxID=3085773 RepID=UPI0039784C1F